MLSCESSVSVKENPDRKKIKKEKTAKANNYLVKNIKYKYMDKINKSDKS